MSRIWSEHFDWTKHQNQMPEVERFVPEQNRAPTLIPRLIYFVSVCSFTFEFHSIKQIQTCLDYYSRKIQPSSREKIGAADHWECQRWFERAPLFLREERKRQQVVKALEQALAKFNSKSTNSSKK
jgi:hypothetical protein